MKRKTPAAGNREVSAKIGPISDVGAGFLRENTRFLFLVIRIIPSHKLMFMPLPITHLFLLSFLLLLSPLTVFSSPLNATRAAIIYGPLNAFERSSPSILANIVLAEEGVDIFYAGPLNRETEEKLFAAFGPAVKAIELTPQPSYGYFVHLLKQLPDIDYYSSWSRRANALSGIASDTTIDDSPYGGNLFALFWQSLAFHALERYEKTVRFGKKYDWVVSIRPDMEFVLPLPSNNFLRTTSLRRMPPNRTRVLFFMNNNQNYMGVSDRFGILSRDAAPIYFLRLDSVLDGSYSKIVKRRKCDECNAERMLLILIEATNVTIIGLHGFGAILCPSQSDLPHGVKGIAGCMVKGYNYKYDDGNPAGEPSVMKGTKAGFRGWENMGI